MSINGKRAVIDGVVSADLFQNDKCVCSADIVLPMYGISWLEKKYEAKGICLSKADKDIPYKFNFTPKDIYLIER